MNPHRNPDGLSGLSVMPGAIIPATRRQGECHTNPPPNRPRSGPIHRWVVGSHLFLLVFLCACCSTRESLQVDMTAQKIVQRHAEAAFEVEFDAEVAADRNALKEYEDKIASAQNRGDLEEAWVAIPALKARGVDFLQKQIFDRAARDGDWPSEAPPTDERAVYVDGVRMAIDSFLQ